MQVKEATNRLVREMRNAIGVCDMVNMNADKIFRCVTRYDAEVEIELKNLIHAIQEEQQPVTETV